MSAISKNIDIESFVWRNTFVQYFSIVEIKPTSLKFISQNGTKFLDKTNNDSVDLGPKTITYQ